MVFLICLKTKQMQIHKSAAILQQPCNQSDQRVINQWISELREWVEAGLICIFIESWILNEARVSSYIHDILRHEKKEYQGKNILICHFGDQW